MRRYMRVAEKLDDLTVRLDKLQKEVDERAAARAVEREAERAAEKDAEQQQNNHYYSREQPLPAQQWWRPHPDPEPPTWTLM